MRKHSTRASLRAPCERFAACLRRLQAAHDGQPVILSPAEWERLTGISQSQQIAVRQALMRAGRLRLSVVDGAWGYALEDCA